MIHFSLSPASSASSASATSPAAALEVPASTTILDVKVRSRIWASVDEAARAKVRLTCCPSTRAERDSEFPADAATSCRVFNSMTMGEAAAAGNINVEAAGRTVLELLWEDTPVGTATRAANATAAHATTSPSTSPGVKRGVKRPRPGALDGDECAAGGAADGVIRGIESLAAFGTYCAETSLWYRRWRFGDRSVETGGERERDGMKTGEGSGKGTRKGGGEGRRMGEEEGTESESACLRLYEGGGVATTATAPGQVTNGTGGGRGGPVLSMSGECMLWPSCVVMARFLERSAEALSLSQSRVLEIGAGAALPSLVAASLGARVWATEQGAAVPYLQLNVDRNTAAVLDMGNCRTARGTHATRVAADDKRQNTLSVNTAVRTTQLSFGCVEEAIQVREQAFGRSGSGGSGGSGGGGCGGGDGSSSGNGARCSPSYILGCDVLYSANLHRPVLETLVRIQIPNEPTVFSVKGSV